MLEHSHNHLFVVASFAIALIAGFSGLSLTRGASQMALPLRKVVVSISAVILGWGIWSMHFVAMLGMKLPVDFFYDPLVTMMSAMIAILMTGLALLIVHFSPRSTGKIVLAGALVGLGIAAMHYVGMSGLHGGQPVYTVFGVTLALIVSVGLSIVSFLVSYQDRTAKRIVLGTFCFAIAVFSAHFVAMAGTGFVAEADGAGSGAWLSNEVLAFGVTASAFVLSGAFLLSGATFASNVAVGNATPFADASPIAAAPPLSVAPSPAPVLRLPYEANAKTHFIEVGSVAAIRAEGHYTVLYSGTEKLFCPWSITEAETRVEHARFLRTHRSYLVNLDHVTSFERKKDNGVCYFENTPALPKVPVSRARLNEVREQLGM